MERDPAKPLHFREAQYFHQPWLLAICLALTLFMWHIAYQQLIGGKPWGNNPATDELMFLFWILFGILLPAMLLTMNLVTEVREDGIFYRFFPLHFSYRSIEFHQIEAFEVVTYRPIREYGGWGIRLGKDGWAYNVSGNRGVRFHLSLKRQILIGSREPEKLANAVSLVTGMGPGLHNQTHP